MLDQAARLREIATELHADRDSYLVPGNSKRTRAQVFAVTSGKGGVGKSHIAVNLALKMREAGLKTLLMDADINLANADILLGQTPQRSIADAIIKDYPIRDVLYAGPEDLHILHGGSGFSEIVELPEGKRARIIRQLESLEYNYDYIIIDTPAGIQKNVLDFVTHAAHAIIIATPEPTSIADAYALVKVLTLQQSNVRMHVVINMAGSLEHAKEIYSKFQLVVDRFLGIPIHFLGYVLKDKHISRATMMQKPVVVKFPKSPASQCLENIAERIVTRGNLKIEEQNDSFFRRVIKISVFQ